MRESREIGRREPDLTAREAGDSTSQSAANHEEAAERRRERETRKAAVEDAGMRRGSMEWTPRHTSPTDANRHHPDKWCVLLCVTPQPQRRQAADGATEAEGEGPAGLERRQRS